MAQRLGLPAQQVLQALHAPSWRTPSAKPGDFEGQNLVANKITKDI